MLKAASDLREKVVIVSTSTLMLDAAAQVCGGLGLPTGRIDGSTAAAVRQELVDQFNDASAGTGDLVKVCSCLPAFLCTLQRCVSSCPIGQG